MLPLVAPHVRFVFMMSMIYLYVLFCCFYGHSYFVLVIMYSLDISFLLIYPLVPSDPSPASSSPSCRLSRSAP